MHYDELKNFIEHTMRMSHIYQPVMLLSLLERGGRASVREIAIDILRHDESQIEYYEKVTKEMVGKVLRNRNVVSKQGNVFELLDFQELTEEQLVELQSLCHSKVEVFKSQRGNSIWEHRTLADGYISGTIRYEVLKQAKFRCELCGISAAEKALQVDHIIPRNKGGTDDLSNFQALCFSCNAMKRDRDDTDFRGILESYQHREKGCVFCELPKSRIVDQNELCVAVNDLYPVTQGHKLIIPKRHVAEYFDLVRPEFNAVHFLLEKMRKMIQNEDSTVSGFNVGVNCGATAGQTVFHCHLHLIPRRKGDMQKPAGGVRHVIPEKGHY